MSPARDASYFSVPPVATACSGRASNEAGILVEPIYFTYCNALNHHAGSFQEVVNIARRFTAESNCHVASRS
jgi:hypothetical protein